MCSIGQVRHSDLLLGIGDMWLAACDCVHLNEFKCEMEIQLNHTSHIQKLSTRWFSDHWISAAGEHFHHHRVLLDKANK